MSVGSPAAAAALADRPPHVPADRVVDIDIYSPPDVSQDFHASWKALQDRLPDIVWTPRNEGHWILMRGKDIHAVLTDWEHFSSKIVFVPKSAGELHTLPPGTIDPPDHKRFRSALNDGLSAKLVAGSRDMIRGLVVNLIESFASRGDCNFSKEFADVLPIQMFMLLMDLPLEDSPKLKFWTDQITRPDGQMTFKEAGDAFRSYLLPHVEARIRNPGSDVLSKMIVSGLTDDANGVLNTEELVDLAGQVLSASLDTVVSFLSFAFLHLATHPDQRHEMAKNPAMLPRALEEMFRRFPLVTTGRIVRKDTELLGMQMKEGDVISLPTLLNGLDERQTPNPMAVDFSRPAVIHTTFGNGPHRCPGANLARMEMHIVMEEWLARIPDFEVKPNTQVEHQGGIVGCIKDLQLCWHVPKSQVEGAGADSVPARSEA